MANALDSVIFAISGTAFWRYMTKAERISSSYDVPYHFIRLYELV
jgi:hypothetical protein